MVKIICTICGGQVFRLPSRPDFMLLQCRIKNCQAVFDYGVMELEDELHEFYAKAGIEPRHSNL